ncbi:MAG TPA: transcription antitermination factor NusB [Terriglobales bacterium]|nr:transcription antitermination factor NusB [Terriglobales bacterium]
MPVSPARAAAFDILLRVENTDAYASELLHSARFATLSPADHRLATELVLGVLRWRSALDERIAEHSSQALAKLDFEVLTALRLAAYQVLFLDRIPKHAAVNESVELVKRARKRSAAGMVNAVLRKVAKHGAEHPDGVAAHPQWLVDRWEQNYAPGIAKHICKYNQNAPATTVRLPTEKISDEVRNEGVQLQSGSLLARAAVVAKGDVTRTTAFREHRLIIQDEASQLVALLVGGARSFLDCCAAPGGKARILAERNPDATVVAMELHPHRASLLRKLVPNKNVRVIAADARTIPLTKQFERVLVDATCTGTGTLARNPEIKWRLSAEDITRMQSYQLEIMRSAMRQVTPDGRLIYSTCSLEPEENSAVVEQALAGNSSFRLIDCKDELQKLRDSGELMSDVDSLLRGPYLRTIPGVHRCDGFFAAILTKQ